MMATQEARNYSILITDDDNNSRAAMHDIMQREGFETLLASSGEEAVDIVRGCAVHLVLLDMHMPKLTGLETIRRLRDRQRFIPCVLMSALADDELVRQARLADVFSVLTKPVSRQVITCTVRSARGFKRSCTTTSPARPSGA